MPTYYIIDNEKLKSMKAQIDAAPERYYMIALGVGEPEKIPPIFWNVVYRKDTGWLEDIENPEYCINFRRMEVNAGFFAITVMDNNFLYISSVCKEHFPSRTEIENML